MSDAPAKDPPANLEARATAAISASPADPASPATASPATASPATSPAPRVPAVAAEPAPKDIVLLGPPTADGAGVHVLRAREERIEAGELRGIQEGRPLTGEIVTLQPRKDNPRVCDVKDSYSPPKAALPLGHKGPATVATDAYRDGWDEVFGRKAPSGSLN